ncbi:uncharacterized protein LOC136025938 [Artemia franciscana]
MYMNRRFNGQQRYQKAFETSISNLKTFFEKQLKDPAYDSETWINRIVDDWYQIRFEIEAKEKEEKKRIEEERKIEEEEIEKEEEYSVEKEIKVKFLCLTMVVKLT